MVEEFRGDLAGLLAQANLAGAQVSAAQADARFLALMLACARQGYELPDPLVSQTIAPHLGGQQIPPNLMGQGQRALLSAAPQAQIQAYPQASLNTLSPEDLGALVRSVMAQSQPASTESLLSSSLPSSSPSSLSSAWDIPADWLDVPTTQVSSQSLSLEPQLRSAKDQDSPQGLDQADLSQRMSQQINRSLVQIGIALALGFGLMTAVRAIPPAAVSNIANLASSLSSNFVRFDFFKRGDQPQITPASTQARPTQDAPTPLPVPEPPPPPQGDPDPSAQSPQPQDQGDQENREKDVNQRVRDSLNVPLGPL